MSNYHGLQKIRNLISTLQDNEEILEKLTTKKILDDEEYELLLLIAIGFYNEFLEDKSRKSYFEFAYYIILEYTILRKDYKALSDFAYAAGFYPICEKLKRYLNPEIKLNSFFKDLDIKSHFYQKGHYFETRQQRNARRQLLADKEKEYYYLAPTSYGKTQLVLEHIRKNIENVNLFAIIVPLKSLLAEITDNVKNEFPAFRVITHDESFNIEDENSKTIFVLTQERAINILREYNEFCFDILYIDEAHHLFEKDTRAMKLSRLIRINSYRNKLSKVLYFSPIVSKGDNLKIRGFSESFDGVKIDLDMKEKRYLYLDKDGNEHVFNRYLNKYSLQSEGHADFRKYIVDKSRNKNFIYAFRPKHIQEIAKELYEYHKESSALSLINEEDREEINIVKSEIKEHLHEYFYGIDYLDYGIVFLHGKLNDTIKEYLEYKFKKISSLRYLVANNVLLEGVNLPLNKMFVMNTYSMTRKKMLNLFGRVNRLNLIFGEEDFIIERLQPEIVFIDSDYEGFEMKNKIDLLRDSTFNDIIDNVNMQNAKVDNDYEEKCHIEDVLLSDDYKNYGQELWVLYYLLNDHNCNEEINLIESVPIINRNIKMLENIDLSEIHFIDLIYFVFISNNESFFRKDGKELLRLQNEKTRNFYKVFNKNRTKPLNMRVNLLVNFWHRYYENQSEDYIYISSSFGEVSHPRDNGNFGNQYFRYHKNKENKAKIYNFASLKLQLDDNFFSYTIFKYLNVLKDLKIISEEEYNKIRYGDIDEDTVKLIKLGLPPFIASKLKSDNMLQFVTKQANGNLGINKEYEDRFTDYLNTLSDLYKFMIYKYIYSV